MQVDEIVEESRRLAQEKQILQVRLETLEREKSMAELQRRTLMDEKAVLQERLDAAVSGDRRKAEEARGEWSAAVQQHSAEIRKLRQENDTLRRQSEVLADECSKKLNQAEIANVRLTSQVGQMQKEAAAKDAELTGALKEAQFMRDNLERVVKELVDRNKRTDDESKRRTAQHEKDFAELLSEHQRRIAEVSEVRRELQQAKEERMLLDTQLTHGRQLAQELSAELDHARAKCQSAEAAFDEAQHELNEKRKHEEDMRADIDELLGKLSKADAHLQRLSDEAAQSNLTALKLRHQLELSEDDASAVRRDKEELVRRLAPLLKGAGEQVDQLASAVDSLLGNVAEAATGSDGGAGPQGGGTSSKAVHFRCWPDAGSASHGEDAPSAESQMLMCALRLRDVTALVIEDAALIQRGVNDCRQRLREAQRKEAVLDDSFRAERAHVLELAAKIGDLEGDLHRCDEQRRTLERTLVESAQWMSEAAAMGDERTRRVEMLVTERNGLEAKVNDLSGQLRDSTSECGRLQKEIERVKADLTAAHAEIRSAAVGKTAADDEISRLKSTVQGLKQQLGDADSSLSKLKSEFAAQKTLEDRADAELRMARKAAEEASQRLASREKDLAEADRREQVVRDQLFESQKRLDAALRRPLGSIESQAAPALIDSPRQPEHAGTPSGQSSSSLPPRPALPAFAAAAAAGLRSSPHRAVASPRRDPTAYSVSSSTAQPSWVSPPRHVGALDRSVGSSSSAATSRPVPSAVTVPTNETFTLAASEGASTDRLRAWEAKINAMLSQARTAHA